MARPRITALLSLLLFGCATWHKNGVALHPPEKLLIAVLPVHADVKIKRLRDIRALPDVRQAGSNEERLVQEEMANVTAAMTSSLEDRLNDTYFFVTVPSERLDQAMTELGIESSSVPFTIEKIQRLGRAVGAQAVLVTRLSGYGKMKKKWLALLIGSGVVEGVVQGVAVAQVVKSDWVPWVVGGQEILREVVVWGGGALLLNKIYTPVILESRLISVQNGKTLWRGTFSGLSNKKALKGFPQEDRRKKHVRLRATADKVQERLIRSLAEKALRNMP